jgi:hypothetical protein
LGLSKREVQRRKWVKRTSCFKESFSQSKKKKVIELLTTPSKEVKEIY